MLTFYILEIYSNDSKNVEFCNLLGKSLAENDGEAIDSMGHL